MSSSSAILVFLVGTNSSNLTFTFIEISGPFFSKTDGFHEIQKRFAANFASQCGYCTPGFVMNGYRYAKL